MERYEALLDVVRRRRSVRRFEPGRSVPRETLLKVLEAGRWAPSGANSQPWDFVCVDDTDVREAVRNVFLRQGERLRQRARGFPAVHKRYLANTAAIVLVLGDARWKICFPQASDSEHEAEYAENNENIFFCSLGAAIQNIQLAVAAVGLTSAWLSGGGEEQTAAELRALLGFPESMRPYGTVPIGYPAAGQALRYRRPLAQLVHWNRYEPSKFRPDELVRHYVDHVRSFAMYRDSESMEDWDDLEERLGEWKDAYLGSGAALHGPPGPRA